MDKILVTARHRHQSDNSLILGNSIRVEVDGSTVESKFVPCLREYDPNAINQIRRKGAIVNMKDQEKINFTVQLLVKKYGLTVQDNS